MAILINQLSDADKGRKVRYTDPGGHKNDTGVITSWNKNFIFVHYPNSNGEEGTATRPQDLTFDNTKLYWVDLKIFQEAPGYEVPFYMPSICYIGDRLRIGYHHGLEMFETEKEMEDFCKWVSDREGILKVIGTTPIVQA